MSNIASIVALPVHAPPAPKEQSSASGKKDGAHPEFAKVLKEQAGPDQSLLGAKLQSIAADDASKLLSTSPEQKSSIVESPIEDQSQWISNLANSNAETIEAKAGDEATQAKLPNLLLTESSGNNKPASDGTPDGGSLILKQPLSIEPGKPKVVTHSGLEKDSQTAGKSKNSTDRKQKTEMAGSVPAAGPIVIPPFSPNSLFLPNVGTVPEQNGAKNQAKVPAEIPSSAQQSGGETSLPQAREPGLATAIPQAGISLPAPPQSEVGLDTSSENNEARAMNVADDAGPSKPAAKVSLEVKPVNSDKLLSGLGTTNAPTGMLFAHGATEASASAAQHEGAASSAAVGATSAANSSPGLVTPNIYDRIDQGAAPVLLHSGAQHVSVGVHDPDLGWVEIQTQSAAGHVDATLVTPSGQAHASLAAQLPAIAQFLEQRDVRVGTLVAHHQAMGSGAFGGGAAGSANSGAGSHHSNPGSSGGEGSSPGYGRPVLRSTRAVSEIDSAARTGGDGAALRAISYISVRA